MLHQQSVMLIFYLPTMQLYILKIILFLFCFSKNNNQYMENFTTQKTTCDDNGDN